MQLRSLPADPLALILDYVDGTDIVRLFCCGDAPLCARLKRFKAFRVQIPKDSGHIDWVKSSALIPRFDALTSISLISGFDHQPYTRALEPSVLPTTLTELTLRFSGIVNTFARRPAMFSHLTKLESLDIEQRSRLASFKKCIWLLDLPNTITRLRIWATTFKDQDRNQSFCKDMENPDNRLWIHSTHIEALIALRKVVDFKSNVSSMRGFAAELDSSEYILKEVNKKIAEKKDDQNGAAKPISMEHMCIKEKSPFFSIIGSGPSFNLTRLQLSLGCITRTVNMELLPSSLVEICIFDISGVQRGSCPLENLEYIDFINFPYLETLIIGKHSVIQAMPWSWLIKMPQSLRRFDSPLLPPADDLEMQELVSTLESRNFDYHHNIGGRDGSLRFVPALITEFQISSLIRPTPEHAAVPFEVIHCFPSLKGAHLSRTNNMEAQSLLFKTRNGSKSENFGWIWPPGLQHVAADSLAIIRSSEAMYNPFKEFLIRESMMAAEERRLNSEISKISSDSSSSNRRESYPASSYSQGDYQRHTSQPQHWTFSQGRQALNKFPNPFNFCASTLTSLTVRSGFTSEQVSLLPYTLQKLWLKSYLGDVWTELCRPQPDRFPHLSDVSLLGHSLYMTSIRECPPTITTLDVQKVDTLAFDCKHLVNLRNLRIRKSSLDWSAIERLPPHLESLVVKFKGKISMPELSAQASFPRSIRLLHFGVSDEISNNPPNPRVKAGYPFVLRELTLSSFLEDESRFYTHMLQGMDSLTSLSVPLIPHDSLMSHFATDAKFLSKKATVRHTLYHWLLLRIPFYGYFSKSPGALNVASGAFHDDLWRKRFSDCFANRKSLARIKNSGDSERYANPAELPTQIYFEMSGVKHYFAGVYPFRSRLPPVLLHGFSPIPILLYNILVYCYNFVSSWWKSSLTLDANLPTATEKFFASLVPDAYAPIVYSFPWIRTWFILSALSTAALSWRTLSGGFDLLAESFTPEGNANSSRDYTFPLWKRVYRCAKRIVSDRAGSIALVCASAAVLIPIAFPSKWAFGNVEGALLVSVALLTFLG